MFTFSAFLNAPIQRYDWLVFGKIFPHLSQGEVNNLVNILTFWQCLLIGYILFAWNRAAAPLRQPPIQIAPQSIGLKVFLGFAAAAAVCTSILLFVASPGLGSWTVAQAIAPASTLAAEAMIFDAHPIQTSLFGIALSTAIISGTWLMIYDETSRVARTLFTVSALVAGVQQMLWGYQLGEPSMAVTAGGGFYMVSGLSLSVFTLIAAYFQMRERNHLWHESMIFALGFAFAPAMLLWGHGLWYTLDAIPAFYIDRGHGYVLAAGAAILLATLNGFICMMTSRETQSRAIS
ncbi:MAG: hypothetical protein AB8B48_18850 [Pseudomonadales bacterium]